MLREWIWLTNIKYVGPVLQKKLLKHFGGCPKNIYQATQDELREVPGITNKVVEQILQSRSLEKVDRILEQVEKRGIKLLTFSDEQYPIYAKQCAESPVLLYYKGILLPIYSAVAVVGARRCTEYGRRVAEELAFRLANLKVPLVSGFAKGIDSYAQAACSRSGGYTIGFLGSGVDICYPPEQKRLYDELLEMGNVFLSKYPPGTPARPEHFLERNALITAWASEVLIVEAGVKSGALSTAKYAQKQGRPLFVVPHSVYASEGMGGNQLLLQPDVVPYLRAEVLKAVRDKEETVALLNASRKNSQTNGLGVLAEIEDLPCSLEKVYEIFKGRFNKNDLDQHLFELELEGKIVTKGNWIHLV